ncbi:MAG: M23 family metallopeptidase [Bacteroides sp.]|nr:M23 family metallopeptidase [Prevotella sp.]MCM1408748.1 M23 family metallopeptidase [Treponema brennaborense]MCM1470663.1 M23 family metallopeptidase [Bacteroides sp.]
MEIISYERQGKYSGQKHFARRFLFEKNIFRDKYAVGADGTFHLRPKRSMLNEKNAVSAVRRLHLRGAFDIDAAQLKTEAAKMVRRLSVYARQGKYIFAALACLYVCSFIIPYAVNALLPRFAPVRFDACKESQETALDAAMRIFALQLPPDDFDDSENLDSLETVSEKPLLPEAVRFTEYTVKSGDNISNISKQFGLANISTLIAVNNIENVKRLYAGQKLQIPSIDGMFHTVNAGQSLTEIAAKYNVSVEMLLDVNDLDSDILQEGSRLFIPGAQLDRETLRDALGEVFRSPLKVAWRLTSPFGTRADPFTGVTSNHTGIDMAAPAGSPILASKGGRVALTGYNNIYGYYVILTHGKGYQTLYAHMQKYTVRTGQYVNQGDKIGLVGSTGYSTGPHLHFTVYKNGKLVSPLSVLNK